MEGLFENFEVLTFQNNDVFVLRMGSDLSKTGLHPLSVQNVIKLVTKDFLVSTLVFHGDIWTQAAFVSSVGKVARAMHDTRKVNPKAPFCPTIHIYTEREFNTLNAGMLRALAYFCKYLQCGQQVYWLTERGYEKVEDNSWDISGI
jgi:hypothetical protein